MAVTRETSWFGEGGGTSNTCEKPIDTFIIGAADWLVHNFESNKDCGVKNNQTLNRGMIDQPAKVTQMILTVERSWIETISVNDCSKHVHQSQQHRGLKGQNNPGRVIGGCFHKFRGISEIITLRVGRVCDSHHGSHLSVDATLVLLIHQTAKRSHPYTDEVSNHAGASSKIKPVGKRVFALAAVRHEKSSDLSSKTDAIR